MNITILMDRSYRSSSDSLRMYKFLSEVVDRLPLKTPNKFRLGAYGSTMSFLCPIAPEPLKKYPGGLRTDFVYQLKSHTETPHQTWTPDTKAELLFLLKGQPFHTEGFNNVRLILEQVTHEGSAKTKADHVVIIACWPVYESSDWLQVMRQTASVHLFNLNKTWVTPEKVAKRLQRLSEKTALTERTKLLTPYEELHLSMLTFLRERAPKLLEEAYGF